MSRILWRNTLLPDLSAPPGDFSCPPFTEEGVKDVIRYPLATAEIAVPDPKAARSVSRAAIFLAFVCAAAKETLAPFLADSPFSVGIYCAVEGGPLDAVSAAKILKQDDPSRFAVHFQKFRNPKSYLKQLPNLAPAYMGITMGIQGPMNVYTDSASSALHALEQAEWDLQDGSVKAALVCSAFAFEDFLRVRGARREESRTLVEGAAAMVMGAGDEFTDWSGASERGDERYSFGIADRMVRISIRRSEYA